MKPILLSLLLLFAVPVCAALPPVFPAEAVEKSQADLRTTTYLSPVRVMWIQNEELVEGADHLLAKGKGQMINAPYPHCVMTSREGRRPSLLLDFGREIQGGVQIVTAGITGHKPARVRVRLGESASEAMCEITPESGATNDHAMRDYVMYLPWYGVSETGNSGFRFVRIDLLVDDVVVPVQEIRAKFTYRDIPYLGSFRSSDPRLDSIWMTGAYTVHLNMQDYLWDGIKRDRLVWMGDAHPELCTMLAVFGDNEVMKKTLDQARDQTPLPGWMNGICAYSLWWALIHHDYYMYTGDLDYLREQQSYMNALFDMAAGMVDGQGHEHMTGAGRFLDWPTSRDRKAVDAGVHALLRMTCDAGIRMAGALGDTALAAKCSSAAERMRKVTPDYATTKQSAALAALAGLVPARQVNEEVLKKGGVEGFSTFYGYYMLQAKAKAGDYAGAIDNIDTYWGAMLDLGATTFWEDFDIKWLDNAARIDELVPEGKVDVHRSYGDFCYKGFRHSFCHGWASGPTAWLSEHVLGISIVEPGCKAVRVRPHLGGLQWAEGTFPTPYGVISVRHERQGDGTVKSKISAPKGVKIVR